MQTLPVRNADDIGLAFAQKARRIDLQPPAGKTQDEFLADTVIAASRLPELAGFDIYEVEAIIRDMSSRTQPIAA